MTLVEKKYTLKNLGIIFEISDLAERLYRTADSHEDIDTLLKILIRELSCRASAIHKETNIH